MMTSLHTTTSAAVELGVTPGRVRAMIASGRLRATLAGRDWLIAPAALEAVRDRKPGRPPLTRRKAAATK
jgi:excisionase family DNA binding protein